MRPRLQLQLAVLILSAAFAGNALGRQQNYEETLELTASMLSLPSVTDGVLVVTCSTCTPLSLQASAATRYFIDDKPVLLSELADYVRTHGTSAVGVTYNTKTNALSRIFVVVHH